MSEISLPEIDYGERQQLELLLANREKERQQLGLDDCFKELTAASNGVSENRINEMAN